MLDLIIGAIAIIGVAGKLMSGSENSHVDSVGQHLENAEHKALDCLQKMNDERYAKKN